ncbi:tyrosine-type recombinase/integrase [Paenibacillus sp. FSL R10-2199]|uniref:tyrosine-type recombinase/integrase n=1 Tax=Paenibacillus sp. FSL R10-2199 TaxID=2975348 RepID=UPI0030FBAE73
MARKPKEPLKYPGVREKDGRFTYRYSIPGTSKTGRKQKETPSFPTAKQAYEAGIRIKAELLNGVYFEEKNILFDDFATEWLTMYAAPGKVKNSTVDIRRWELKKCSSYFGNKKIGDITKLDYQKMLDDQKNKGAAKNTISLLNTTCRMLFKKAVDLGIIKNNPTNGAELPAYTLTVEDLENKTELPHYLERDELSKLLTIIKIQGELQDYNLFFLLAYTGMRIGELAALKTKDINKVEGFISITKTIYMKGSATEFSLNTPKTKSSHREVEITPNVLSVLENQLAWRNEFKMSRRKEYYDKDDFVFVNNKNLPGYPLNIISVGKRFKDYLELAKLPSNLSPHSLRHTHVSLLAEIGIDIETIQERLGHSNAAVTRRIYLHVTKKRKKDAPIKFDLFMNRI